MNPRPFDWSTIPNIEVRGKRRTCVARIEVNGREVWRTTKIEADTYGRNAEDVREWMRAFRLQMVKDSDRLLALTRTRSELCTFAELIAAYRIACAGRDISPATMERNIKDLRLIVRGVHGEKFSVDAARVSLCTVDLLIDFRSNRFAALKAQALAQKWDAEKYQAKLASARRTIKSTIQHARSIFAQECLQEKPYRELALPAADVLTKFMKFRSGGGTTREFEMPDASVLERLRDGAQLFKASRPDLWLALVLTANFGMRRGSAKNARWDWFRTSDAGAVAVHVRVGKGNKSRVGVTPATWAAAQLQRGAPLRDFVGPPYREYVLPGADEEARNAILDELLRWLRGIGFDEARCPVHELRGLFVNKMAAEHSLDDAQGATGHSTQKVMMDSYVARGTDKAVDVI